MTENTKTTILPRKPRIGRPCHFNGRIVVFTESHGCTRITEDDPSVYGSHLLGYEGDTGVRVSYRPASDEEIAMLDELTAKRRAIREIEESKRQRLSDLAQQVRNGEKPANANPEGDMVCSTRTSFGMGDWFVIDEVNGWIWFVVAHTADGDLWDANNAPAGIASRIPFDAGIAAELRELDQAFPPRFITA